MMVNAERFQAGTKKHSLATLVAAMPENVTYSSGGWDAMVVTRDGVDSFMHAGAALRVV